MVVHEPLQDQFTNLCTSVDVALHFSRALFSKNNYGLLQLGSELTSSFFSMYLAMLLVTGCQCQTDSPSF